MNQAMVVFFNLHVWKIISFLQICEYNKYMIMIDCSKIKLNIQLMNYHQLNLEMPVVWIQQYNFLTILFSRVINFNVW